MKKSPRACRKQDQVVRCHMNTLASGQPQCLRRAVVVCKHGSGYCKQHLKKAIAAGMTCPTTPVAPNASLEQKETRK